MSDGKFSKIGVFDVLQSLLLALIVRAAFENSFPNIFGNLSLKELIESGFPNGPSSLQIIQFLVFFLMLIRFYGGAFQFNHLRSTEMATTGYHPLSLFINISGTCILFCFFYISALKIYSDDYFYLSIFLMHLVDLVWFFLVIPRIEKTSPMRGVVVCFIWFSVLTILVFSLIYWKVSGDLKLWLYLATLAFFSILDFAILWKFYVNSDEWYAERKAIIERKTKDKTA